MPTPLDPIIVRNFAIALLIGALVGIEREKRRAGEGYLDLGGIRTFTLFALTGAVSAWLAQHLQSSAVFIGAILGVSATVVAGYVMQNRNRSAPAGLTTPLAAIAVCLLGGMTMAGFPELAVALGIVVSATLAYKQPLHGAVRRLDPEDIFAGLRLLIATFVILPLLPDEPVDPWQALNPYALWWLVILISSLSLVGYVATRWLGAQKGTALTGLTGGLVSSTAVTLTFARRSRDQTGFDAGQALACGIVLAWGMMFARVLVEVAVVNRALMGPILVPFSAMALATAALAAWYYRRSTAEHAPAAEPEDVPLRNPFSLTEAAKFAAFFAAVLLVVKLTQEYLPGSGLYMVAMLAGLTDVDAITLSMAQYAAQGGDAHTAVVAIVIAALSNTVVKAAIVLVLGAGRLRTAVASAVVVIVASGSLGLILS